MKTSIKKLLRHIMAPSLAKLINFYRKGEADFCDYSHFDYWQSHGFNLTPNHFYQPIPDISRLDWKRIGLKADLTGIDMGEKKQLKLLMEKFLKLRKEFSEFKRINSRVDVQKDPNFYFNNLAFDGVDALVYYAMIREFKPKKIIEIGSGWSTKIAAKACLLNGNCQLYSIEPYPQAVLENGFPGLGGLIKSKVEDIPLSYFEDLNGGDFLFIDSSHTVKIGGDVNFIIFEVLPRLKKGVYVHFHDIFLPFDYPKKWVVKEHRFWTEQYLLQAFLLHNKNYEVVYANNYMAVTYPMVVNRVFGGVANQTSGGSFWIKKVS